MLKRSRQNQNFSSMTTVNSQKKRKQDESSSECAKACSASHHEPDTRVMQWRTSFAKIIFKTCFDNQLMPLAILVMDFLVPCFVTLPNFIAPEHRLQILSGNLRPAVYRVATLETIHIKETKKHALRRVEIVLVAQPFCLDCGPNEEFKIGIDTCDLSSEILNSATNYGRRFSDQAKQLFLLRTPETIYQTRIIVYARHG
jgi:hypothetical protein